MAITPESLRYQKAHLNEKNIVGPQIICYIGLVIATVSVALRISSRRILGVSLKADDWTILLALFFFIPLMVCNFLAVYHFGMGRHAVAVGAPKVSKFLEALWFYSFLHTLTILLIKISILLLYHRIFIVPRFQKVVKASLLFMILYLFSTLLVDFMVCIPVRAYWDTTIKGRCIDRIKYYIATAALNIFTDLWILILPMPMVWKLQISLRQKLILCGIFLIGGVVCITTIMRGVTYPTLDYNDITWSAVQNGYWTNCELYLSFLCACLPTMRPVGKLVTSSIKTYASRSHSSHESITTSKQSHGHSTGKGTWSHSSVSHGDESGAVNLVPATDAHVQNSEATAWYEEEPSRQHRTADLERGDRMVANGQGIKVQKDIEFKEFTRNDRK